MTDQQLFEHNAEASAKVKEAFMTSNRAAIVHATGTGKSFVIADVAKDYDRVIVIAPNNYVLNETQARGFKAEFKTYPAIMNVDDFETDRYDLIVLDEFHRAGAEIWGAGIQRLLDANPDAKVLGASATEIRYLDNSRNMADELFEQNVVSRISLADAWADGILPVPKYVTALYSFNKVYDEYKQKLERNSNRFDNEGMNHMKELLERGKLAWETSLGAEKIFKKHFSPDIKRMLVFCENLESIDEYKSTVSGWLANAGIESKNYVVSSFNNYSEQEMMMFRKDDFDGVKVMFSVNMLNEGIHVENVDAILMLRPTKSRNIYLQQMGRCLSTKKGYRPIIFDFVDNMSLAQGTDFGGIYELQEEVRAKRAGERMESDGFRFRDFIIEDNVLSMREMMKEFGARLAPETYEEKLERLKAWCEKNNRMPVSNGETLEERSLYTFFLTYKGNKELQSLRDKYGYSHTPFELRYPKLVSWCEDNGRLPKRYTKDPVEVSLAGFFNAYIKTPEMQSLCAQYGYEKKKTISSDERMEQVKEWCRENGKIPSKKSKDPYEKTLGYFVAEFNRKRISLADEKTEEDFLAFLVENGYRKPVPYKDRLIEFKKWCEDNGRLPNDKVEDPDEVRFRHFMFANRKRPEIKELRDKYGLLQEHIIQNRFNILKKWCAENDRLPKNHSEDPEEKRIYYYLQKLRHYEAVKQLIKDYKFKCWSNAFGIRFSELEKWCEENGRLPSAQSQNNTEKSFGLFIRTNKKRPEIIELKNIYPNK